MRGKTQTETYRKIRHAGRLRMKLAIKADRRAWRQGKVDHPIPDARALDHRLVEGAYADIPVRPVINRYVPTRDLVVESYEKVNRLRRRRQARKAKRIWQESLCFASF